MTFATQWETGNSKSAISKSYSEKLNIADKIQPCRGVQLLSANGKPIEPIWQVKLDITQGKLKLNHPFIVGKNLRWPLILGLDFYHKFQIGTGWDKTENGSFIVMGNYSFMPNRLIAFQKSSQ